MRHGKPVEHGAVNRWPRVLSADPSGGWNPANATGRFLAHFEVEKHGRMT